jgi:hypothetical protein
LGNQGKLLTLSKEGTVIKFDKIFETKEGYVCGIEMCPTQTSKNAYVTLERGKTIDVNKMHQLLGHTGEDIVKKTANYFGWKVTGNMEKCEDCSLSKARQKNTDKETKERNKTPGERLFIDIRGCPVLRNLWLGKKKVPAPTDQLLKKRCFCLKRASS